MLLRDLRKLLDWDSMLVADATGRAMEQLIDTSPTDRHVVAAAVEAG
jgi:hypothetical protein